MNLPVPAISGGSGKAAQVRYVESMTYEVLNCLGVEVLV